VSFLDRLDELTAFRESASEVTLEANPESLDEDKARALKAAGVNRLSIGFQSLRPEVLELFGRVHAVDDSFRAFEAARRAEISAISIDMIYATQGQSLAEWEHDLSRVLSLGPDHLSAYNLTFEEETPFARWLEEGRIEKAPEELELELFAATRELCAARGLEAYEISNFARPGEECRHNLGYWRNHEYAGVGPSAVSKIGQERGGNPRALGAWSRGVRADGRAVEWSEELPWPERLAETWWLGLRLTQGIESRAARATARVPADLEDERDPAIATAERLCRTGHLLRSEAEPGGARRYRLAPSALALADAVAARFLSEVPVAQASAPRSDPARGPQAVGA
jgi:oxygen-independent coproporphyrinogen-3 oxidase